MNRISDKVHHWSNSHQEQVWLTTENRTKLSQQLYRVWMAYSNHPVLWNTPHGMPKRCIWMPSSSPHTFTQPRKDKKPVWCSTMRLETALLLVDLRFELSGNDGSVVAVCWQSIGSSWAATNCLVYLQIVYVVKNMWHNHSVGYSCLCLGCPISQPQRRVKL